MTAEDDIAFMESFREKITAYLVAGTAPTQDPLWGGSVLVKMEEAMKDPAFRALRQDINRMKGRAVQILEGFSINCTFTQYPPPAVGGPVTKFPLFNLITDNQSLHTVEEAVFTDKIDEAIGLLETRGDDDLSRGALPVFEVRDLAKALEFYRDRLGFAAEARLEETTDTVVVVRHEAGILLCAEDAPTPTRAIVHILPPGGGLGQETVLRGQTYLEITDPDGNRLLFDAVG